MDIILVNSTIRGIKSIDKDLNISYVKKNFDSSVFNECHIKTIYGTNGSGKTGIAHAYEFFCFLAANSYPLKDNIFTSKFKQLINKKTREFFIENTFAINLSNETFRYKYSFTVAKDASDELFFKNEKLVILNKRLDESQIVFEINNGVIVKDIKYNLLNIDASPISLRQNTYLRTIVEEVRKKPSEEREEWKAIMATMYFILNLNVSFGSENDNHETFDYKSVLSFDKTKIDKNDNLTLSFVKKMGSTVRRMMGDRYLFAINPKEENKYKRITKKLSLFLQKLNSNVRDVEISFKHDGVASYCFLTFIYDGYTIDYEFESTGIKKICSLFFSLYNASRGHIVFIDEIDAGIHDVFLTALIGYFVSYTDCQIIMTTHHVGIMEVVKEISKSIDILTDECVIETWTKNGDSSPSSLFKKGYLNGTPFNIKPFDFADVFAEDDD